MTNEFNLSDRITKGIIWDEQYEMIFKQDVKEFIKRLKEELSPFNVIDGDRENIFSIIDRLSGDKLI